MEVLKRHMSALKDDEEFTQYIIDMAGFLVEYKNYKVRTATPLPGSSSGNGQDKVWLSRASERDLELERVLRKHASRRDSGASCKLCGSPTAGEAICPHCGNMSF